jgi:hypothetical protein
MWRKFPRLDRRTYHTNTTQRYYIEFRFANIYHALTFKRQLMDDPEWEHCTIAYASDPCETANGVHFKDEDEQGSGFFA